MARDSDLKGTRWGLEIYICKEDSRTFFCRWSEYHIWINTVLTIMPVISVTAIRLQDAIYYKLLSM